MTHQPYSRLSLWWPALSMDFLAAELDSLDRAELYHCHGFVQTIAELARQRVLAGLDSVKAVPLAEEIYKSVKDMIGQPRWKAAVLGEVQRVFPEKEIVEGIESSGTLARALATAIGPTWVQRRLLPRRLSALYERAVASLEYFSEHVARFYFGRVSELAATRILADSPPVANAPGPRVHIIDLPSLADRRVRLLAINSILGLEWEAARAEWKHATARPPEEDARVPTFVVVDEAHHVVPAETTDDMQRSIREQFRTLVAEGRKYGLFVILVSQRPEKLDELVIGECQNRVVMRLNSRKTLDETRRILGLDDVPRDVLNRTLTFGIGRALLAGEWRRGGPELAYAAARRTVEGGRNLRAEYWAAPPEDR